MTTVRCASLLALVAAALPGGGDDARFSPGAEALAEAQRTAILAEVATLADHAWAGKYYAGDGMGENVSLALAPRAGFVFEWHGCLGLYDRNFGAVEEVNGR